MKHTRGRRGFSLIEVLITIVIIGITAGMISRFQTNTWTSTRRTNNVMVASQLIMQELENLRIDIARDTSTYWPPVSGTRSDAATRMSLAWTVSNALDPTGASINHVRQVRYAARWTGPKADSVVVVTFLGTAF